VQGDDEAHTGVEEVVVLEDLSKDYLKREFVVPDGLLVPRVLIVLAVVSVVGEKPEVDLWRNHEIAWRVTAVVHRGVGLASKGESVEAVSGTIGADLKPLARLEGGRELLSVPRLLVGCRVVFPDGDVWALPAGEFPPPLEDPDGRGLL